MRLIDADKLKSHYAWWDNGGAEFRSNKKIFDDIVDVQPTIEIEKTGNTVTMTSRKYLELTERAERPKGKLIEEWDGYTCSNCQMGFSEEIRFLNYRMGMPKFCPSCGAEMEEEE